jgi:hypothetical protein
MGISLAPGLQKAEQRGKADQGETTDDELLHLRAAQFLDDICSVATGPRMAKSPAAGTPFGAHLITELMPSIVPFVMASTAAAVGFAVIRLAFLLGTVLFVEREFLPHADTKFGH